MFAVRRLPLFFVARSCPAASFSTPPLNILSDPALASQLLGTLLLLAPIFGDGEEI